MGKQATKQTNTRPISVEFVHRWKRDTVFNNKRSLKNSGIAVSEKLVPNKLSFFKKVPAKNGSTSCWTWKGNVYIVDSNGLKKLITSENDLN